LREIGDKLLTVTDPGPETAPYESPRRVVLDYEIMDDVYQGGDLEWGDLLWPCADMMVGLAENYRASWESTMGELRFALDPQGRLELAPNLRSNTSNWSGDHASNSPALVTGIFFSHRPVEVPEEGISVLHVAPTILDALGVEVPPEMDRAALGWR